MLSPQLFLGRSQNLPLQDLAILGSEHSGLDYLGGEIELSVSSVDD